MFDQLVPTIETAMIGQIVTRATKAHLPGEIISDIKRDAAWNPAAKRGLEIASAQVAAKWMNKTGLSAEYQPELVLTTSVAIIAGQHMQILSRLDQLIAKTNPPVQQPAKPEEKKP